MRKRKVESPDSIPTKVRGKVHVSKKDSASIPNELILEIFSRLPAKSIGRFCCVSKLWGSILDRPYFKKLFMTRSTARPRLLFLLEGDDHEWNFYSSPQPQNPYGKSSFVVAADFHTKIRGEMYENHCNYASGLIYFPQMWYSKKYNDVVWNPITGQHAILPEVTIYRKSTSFLGFDPIDKQFKVLSEGYPFCDERDHHKLLTFGAEKLEWTSKIDCPFYNTCWSGGICINGVLYYLASTNTLAHWVANINSSDDQPSHVKIVCFDVRSEKFKLINTRYCSNSYSAQYATKLINYKGKLGGITVENNKVDNAVELHMWVLEDVEKNEWSKHVYTLPENKLFGDDKVFVAGVTATSDIVLATDFTPSKPFYVFYFNTEKKTLQSVEIKGFSKKLGKKKVFKTKKKSKKLGTVKVFVDHVEDLSFII